MRPVILTAALVGAELTRDQTPYLPLTSEEIVEAARCSVKAGAAVLHLHVRDDLGIPTNRSDVFKKVISDLRDSLDPTPILQVSTGGALGDTAESRLQPLCAAPDMASLNAGSVNFGDQVFANPLPLVRRLAETMRSKKIKPEIEIYDLSHLETALLLIQEGLILTPAHFQFVMGVKGAVQPTEENLKLFVDRLPNEATWTVAGIGRHEFPMAELALKMGGHVRVGLEDNIYLSKGVLAKGSHELIEKAVELACQYGRSVATLEEARRILKLS